MSLNMDQKRRLLESIEYIDDAMISDTMSRVNTDAVTAGMPSKGKRHMIWIKQVSVLAACALLLGAIIPVMTFVSKNVDLFSGFGAGADPGVEETEPLSEVVETEPPEPEVVPDEHGSEGLRYMINEDGTTASFIGWGDFKGKTAYIGSVYEGVPVTKIVFYEVWEQQERLKELLLTNPDHIEQTIAPDDFTFPNIKHVVIPDSVEYVEAGVINQCDHIETLHIGAGVNEIMGVIFFNGERGQNFSKITVSPDNQYYTVKGNCLISIENKVLLCGFADSVIPNDGSVEIIGDLAFYNKPGLTSVVVPEGVIEIRSSAFATIEELTSVSLPLTINILYGAFRNHPALTEFKFAGTVEQWMDITKRGFGWIEKTSLTQVTCSDGVVELKFDSHGDLVDMIDRVNLSVIAIDNIDLSAGTEVGVELAYESDDFIIFYGSIGLFGYDLNKKEIIFAVDFMKAVGIEGSIQGSRGTSVEVSTDGKKIIISDYDVERNVRHKTCYIDVPTLTYTISDYEPLDKTFERDSAKGYIYPGVKVGQVKYIIDSKEWIIFDK